MPDFHINDDWILKRISKQSNSFSEWMSGLIKGIEKTLEEVNPEALEEFKKDEMILSFQELDKDLSEA
ncbi:MAG: hypothetical protein ACFE9Z_10460, partial [Promethearchaeota archaeon]